jgi:hypothetical protein
VLSQRHQRVRRMRLVGAPRARAACIAHCGTNCMACGMEFATFYGDISGGYVHIQLLVVTSHVPSGALCARSTPWRWAVSSWWSWAPVAGSQIRTTASPPLQPAFQPVVASHVPSGRVHFRWAVSRWRSWAPVTGSQIRTTASPPSSPAAYSVKPWQLRGCHHGFQPIRNV